MSAEEVEQVNQQEAGGSADNPSNSGREQDRLLPVSNVTRIMKKVIPHNFKVSKGSKETVQDCVSEFIGFITAEAAEILKSKKRKTVNSEDILLALENTGFGAYKECLIAYTNILRAESNKKAISAADIVNDDDHAKSNSRGRKRKQPVNLEDNEEKFLTATEQVPETVQVPVFDFPDPVFGNLNAHLPQQFGLFQNK